MNSSPAKKRPGMLLVGKNTPEHQTLMVVGGAQSANGEGNAALVGAAQPTDLHQHNGAKRDQQFKQGNRDQQKAELVVICRS